MLVPTNNVKPKAFLGAQIALENPKQQVVLLGNFIPSKHALNTGKQSVIIILQYPLHEKINDFLERSFYPLMSVFFKRADRLKPIAICSSWRVQK